MKMEISITCCLCSKGHKAEFLLPEGWENQYDGHDIERTGFCPDHAPIKAFTDAQCVGCVGGWGDCSMWKAFAYTKNEMTDLDFATLESGKCPKRTNGTFSLAHGAMSDIDLSDEEQNAGVAFAQAIKQYIAKYHSPRHPAR